MIFRQFLMANPEEDKFIDLLAQMIIDKAK